MFHFGFLWGLLALPGIFFLFWIAKQRTRKKIYVSTLEIWSEIVDQKVSNYKINYKPELWLAVAAYLFFILSLSEPGWLFENKQKFVIVIDRSASMNSKVHNKSLFEIAIEETDRILQAISDGDIEIILFPDKISLYGKKNTLLISLKQQKPTYQDTDFSYFVSQLYNDKKIFYIISDGNEKIELQDKKNVNFINIGLQKTDNVGFTYLQSALIDHSKWQIFFSVTNFSQNTCTVNVTVADNNKIITSLALKINPGEEFSHSVLLEKVSDYLYLKINEPDNFEIDNIVYLVKKKNLNFWASPDYEKVFYPLERAITGLSIVSEKELADIIFSRNNEDFQGRNLSQKIVTLTSSQNNFSTMSTSKIIALSHPILDWVFKTEITATSPVPFGKYKSLWATKEGCILGLEKNLSLYIGFDILQTNWYQESSFPVLWFNYFNFIAPDRGNFVYKLSDKDEFTTDQLKKTARNFISKAESNNISKSISSFAAQVEKGGNSIFFSQQSIFIGLTVAILLILWYHKKLNFTTYTNF